MRFWVNILRNPHFIFDVHVTEVVDASLHVIAQTFMDACTKTEHKLSRVSSTEPCSQRAENLSGLMRRLICSFCFWLQESPSNKLLYAKEISTYKKMVDEWVFTEPHIQAVNTELRKLIVSDLLCQQLLQWHQPDSSSQWPGHEHAPRRGVPGTSFFVFVKPGISLQQTTVTGFILGYVKEKCRVQTKSFNGHPNQIILRHILWSVYSF